MPSRYAYLHGFASSSRSTKGVALAERFAARGIPLELPDLNAPSFSAITYTDALAVIDGLTSPEPDATWRLVGSSMGGYLAARWAELHPERVDRLVLLCPGFDLPSRWPAILGEAAMAQWRAQGALTLPDATGRPTKVHWGFLEDALTHPREPEVRVPTLIIHGTRDETVPIDGSRAYAARRSHVRLVEVDDDHSLGASIDRIAEETLTFFGIRA